jgi:membrane protein DedA with SNARE-associated domain
MGVLDAVAQWAEDVVLAAGYPGLALLILAENLLPPIPSELILPLAGFQVAKGELDFAAAVLWSTGGSVLGALAIYALGRHGGRPLLRRHRRLLRLRERDLDRADRWFLRRADRTVLLGRLVPGVRSVVSFPAGVAGMGLGRFVVLTALGSAAWNALLIGAGWRLGSDYERAGDLVGQASTVVAGALAAGAVLALAVLVRRRRSARG